jgi:hypothetical protein
VAKSYVERPSVEKNSPAAEVFSLEAQRLHRLVGPRRARKASLPAFQGQGANNLTPNLASAPLRRARLTGGEGFEI